VATYARAAEASAGAGDLWAAAYGDCNIGEVLADRGRYEEAEQRLRRARRIWRGSEDAAGVAFTSALLGRLAVRAGQHERGATLLEDAAQAFRALHTADDAALAEAYLAEAAVFAGRSLEALAASEGAREEAEHTAAAIVLLRVRGCAHAQLGDHDAARRSLEAALARAREQHERYEIALALDALVAIGGGDRDAAALERDELLAGLGVERLPAPPLRT